ncbi:type II toxin-antitoxin system VapC family toxin [Calothrix sp. PCC 6303]|uniref:type II toxin-antitoxin system VapC family toxin n=1 Tax=Calothrix sp. PCC 6303 TaxID=1170562 RepID=UPI0002A0501C|nr:type II toxin-antitoxin system VapC family toxin [Calothrix sp. PCC 6303]AFZ00261.1 PilT protein domain protein [Calothrix sp. PCC 6303]
MDNLLDTDTCIYWLNGREVVRNKLLSIGLNNVSICSISVAELYYGAYNSSRVEENLIRAERFIQNMTVIPLNNDSLKLFGELKAELRKLGQPVADFDLLIASVAITERLVLVTNNTRHYERIPNIQLENWTLID